MTTLQEALAAARAHLEQPTEPAPSLTKIEDPVTVPRGLLGAACRAIAHKDDAPNTLEQLRQYTVGNLSPSMTGKAARSLDKAWSLFCSEIGEDKSPYPGMIGAFEAHYGQSFKDKDWRNEASVWAQAWSAATRAALLQSTALPDHPERHLDMVVALAQQELPQKERPDFMAGYDAGMADAKRMAQQGEPVAYMAKNKNGGTESLIRARLLEQIGRSDDHDYTPLYAGVAPAPVEQRCTYCDGTGDVHSIDGEWRGTCHCAAAPTPQAQEITGCACRWDADDKRIATCVRHQGWLDVVHEWAERAKAAEVALQSAQPKQEPLTDRQVHMAVLAFTNATHGEIHPTYDEMKAALLAAEKARGE